jgi:UDP-N-acetylglucosamine acyltransferase
MVASCSMVVKDVPPFTNVQGDRARLIGLNVEGMKRKGFSAETIANLKKAYRILFRTSVTLDEAIAKTRSEIEVCPEIETFLEFIKGSERGVTR